MKGDKPDAKKRLMMDSYSLYRVKGAPVKWDGKQLEASGQVGAQSGFSVVSLLTSLGVQVDDGSRSADDNLKKLALGLIVALALQTEEGDNSIAANPEFSARIERMQSLLVEKPYFLIFSKRFHAAHAHDAEQV